MKKFQMLFLIGAAMLLAACSGNVSVQTALATTDEDCFCECRDMTVGANVSVAGEITRLEERIGQGIYLELETDAECLQRVWIDERFWQSWTADEQALVHINAPLEVEGLFALVDGKLMVDMAMPPMP